MVISFTMPKSKWAHLRYILLKANVKQLIHKPMLYVINDFVYSKKIFKWKLHLYATSSSYFIQVLKHRLNDRSTIQNVAFPRFRFFQLSIIVEPFYKKLSIAHSWFSRLRINRSWTQDPADKRLLTALPQGFGCDASSSACYAFKLYLNGACLVI